MKKTRKYLSAEGLIKSIQSSFKKIKDPQNRNGKISILDCLMSCLAIFSLKYSSLLQYEVERKKFKMLENFKRLYLVENPPSDTYMRERLDLLKPEILRSAFKKIFALIQRGKDLESYQYLDDYYLLSIDGTGHFSSEKVHCKNCCVKHHRSGKTTYYHQMLGAVLVHPDNKAVIPFCPEPIVKTDGTTKNDCGTPRSVYSTGGESPHKEMFPAYLVPSFELIEVTI